MPRNEWAARGEQLTTLSIPKNDDRDQGAGCRDEHASKHGDEVRNVRKVLKPTRDQPKGREYSRVDREDQRSASTEELGEDQTDPAENADNDGSVEQRKPNG